MNRTVIVVGAGCAGLSATYTLRKQGVDVIALEAKDTAGGRCRSEYDQGFTFSMGAVLTQPQWQTTFAYLDELGLRDRAVPLKTQRHGIVRHGRVRTFFVGERLTDMLKAVPENARFLIRGMPWKVYPQLVRVSLELRRHVKRVDVRSLDFASLAELSNVSTEEFVLKHGGPEVLDYLAHPLLASFVISRPRDVSIIHPILLMSLMKGMFGLNGGLGALTAALYEKVRQSVRLSTPAREIVIRNGKIAGVRTDDGIMEADAVICALDAVDARALMPDLPLSMRMPLETCRYGSTYYYQFAQQSAEYAVRTDLYGLHIPASEPTPLAYIGCAPLPGLKPVIVAGTRGWEDAKLAAMSDADRLRLVAGEIKKYLPGFSENAVVTKMFRWDRAVNLESPGQFTAIQNLLKHHMDEVGGLYLAGKYLFPIACTEGALMTGKAAAERVMAAGFVPVATPAA